MTERLRAAIYTRISSDPEGLALGVERQKQDCLALAQRLKLDVVAVYEENDVSASSKSRKPRPQYEAMMRSAEAGEVDALVFYSASRLTRRPFEYPRIIELVAQRGTALHTVASGTVDLTTADGRAVALTLAVWDGAEAERISERVTRAAKQRAESGQFHGSYPAFGYQQVKEVIGGRERVVAWKVDPVHAAWLKEAARRVLAGETVYGITADWNRQGRVTGKGAVWRPRTLKRALLSPAVIGKRGYKGEMFDAVWPPILDRKSWDRLHSVLEERAGDVPQFDPKGNKRKYVLSGLVRCSDCGAVMRSMGASKAGAVGFVHPTVDTTSPTHPHHGQTESRRIAMEPLEDWVVAGFLRYIDTPAVRKALKTTGKRGQVDQSAPLREAIEDDRRRLERAQDMLVDELLDEAGFKKQRDRLLERIKANQEALTAITGVRAVDLPSAREVRAMWEDADNTRKRDLLAQFIDRIEVGKMPKGVATRLTRKKGESDQDYAERIAAHSADVLDQRVNVVWKF